jgi:hypothetical protein
MIARQPYSPLPSLFHESVYAEVAVVPFQRPIIRCVYCDGIGSERLEYSKLCVYCWGHPLLYTLRGSGAVWMLVVRQCSTYGELGFVLTTQEGSLQVPGLPISWPVSSPVSLLVNSTSSDCASLDAPHNVVKLGAAAGAVLVLAVVAVCSCLQLHLQCLNIYTALTFSDR